MVPSKMDQSTWALSDLFSFLNISVSTNFLYELAASLSSCSGIFERSMIHLNSLLVTSHHSSVLLSSNTRPLWSSLTLSRSTLWMTLPSCGSPLRSASIHPGTRRIALQSIVSSGVLSTKPVVRTLCSLDMCCSTWSSNAFVTVTSVRSTLDRFLLVSSLSRNVGARNPTPRRSVRSFSSSSSSAPPSSGPQTLMGSWLNVTNMFSAALLFAGGSSTGTMGRSSPPPMRNLSRRIGRCLMFAPASFFSSSFSVVLLYWMVVRPRVLSSSLLRMFIILSANAFCSPDSSPAFLSVLTHACFAFASLVQTRTSPASRFLESL